MKRLILLLLLLPAFANAQVITTVVGNGIPGYSGDGGPASSAKLRFPTQVIFGSDRNMYIVDAGNACIRYVDTSGIISRFAGVVGSGGYGGDGGPATAAFFFPVVLAFDGIGNAYVADGHNGRVRIIDTAGIVRTFAGSDTSGYGGDGGPATAAKLSYPNGVAVDLAGNVFISDYANHCIRKVDTFGIISTVVGNGTSGYSGDGGPATAANLFLPCSILPDGVGNLYIMDGGNSVVRKVDATGIITTIAGNHISGYNGDGGPATLAQIRQYAAELSFDGFDNLYFGDFQNNVIRKVNLTSGIINTVAGNGLTGYSGDGGPALACRLNGPAGIAFDDKGNAYISDYYNNRVRKIGNFLSIRGSNIICVGGTSALTDTVSGGSWSSGNTSIITVDSHTGITTGIAPGMATIYYTKPGYSASFTMMVKTALVAGTFSASLDSVCIDDTVRLHNSTIGGQWSSDNTAVATITTDGLLTGISSGTVNLQYILRNVCGSDTAIFSFVVGNSPCHTYVKNSNSSDVISLAIAPNPNHGLFIVNISSPSKEDATIIITNIFGEKVKELTTTTNINMQIKLDEPPGVYFVTVVSMHENQTANVMLW